MPDCDLSSLSLHFPVTDLGSVIGNVGARLKAFWYFIPGLILIPVQLASAQAIQVTGKVRDERGYPIPFASVILKKKHTAASTDTAGFFSIRVKPNTLLLVRAIGFEDAIINTKNQTTLTIVLKLSKKSSGKSPPTGPLALGRKPD